MSILTDTMSDLMYSDLNHIQSLVESVDQLILAKLEVAREDCTLDFLIECGDVDGHYCCDDCDDCDDDDEDDWEYEDDELSVDDFDGDEDDYYWDSEDPDYNDVDIDDLEGDFENYD